MTTLQKMIFLLGALVAISVDSTVIVLVLERLFPNARVLIIAGPLLCVGAVLGFNKYYRNRI
ncbi:hypothetical protein [Mesorhizobium sp. Mes31]|uniref:hypothetical protein n=1 Tax=Mesorhizobium sp. Mes31 TaxID=2926017 RepID=UPI00211835C0|nr:hypothetical protein [Mesorhizobium sp. Mes31]